MIDSLSSLFLAGCGALSFVLIVWLGRKASATTLFCIGLAAELFSGNWHNLGVPSGLDRALIYLAFISVIVKLWRQGEFSKTIFGNGYTYLFAAAIVFAVISTYSNQGMNSGALFAIFDRLGVIPFAAFLLAPILFKTHEQRNLLIATLVAVGAYLSVTAIGESLDSKALVFPSYILDPTLGIHYGRARGPFLDATAEGLVLIGCLAASVAAAQTWHRISWRLFAAFTGVGCVVACLLTLTRQVWIAAALGLLVGLAINARTRRYLVPIGAVAVVAVLLTFALVPGLHHKANGRADDQLPVWDRLNLDAAALRAVEDKPLLGVGFLNFQNVGSAYFRQAHTYPVTGVGNTVHNVYLLRLAEGGVIGGGIWLLALAVGVFYPLIRRVQPGFTVWKQVCAIYVIGWAVSAGFAPLSASMPNMLLWTFAGMVNGAATGDMVTQVVGRHHRDHAFWEGWRVPHIKRNFVPRHFKPAGSQA